MIEILKRFFKGSAVYSSGNILHKLIAFLLIPIYTRFLSTSDYGIVALTNAIIGLLIPFFMLGQLAAVTRFYFDYYEDKDELSNYLSTVFVLIIGINLMITISLAIFGKPLFGAIFKNLPFNPYIKFALWIPFFSVPISVLLGLYRAREQSINYMIIKLSQFLITVSFIIYFVVFLKKGAFGKIQGQFYGALLFFIVFLILIKKEISFSISLKKTKKTLLFGLPLVPHLMAAWILGSADSFLIERFRTLSEVGLYNLGYQFGTIILIAVSSMALSWGPIFYETAEKRKDAQEIFGKIFSMIITGIFTFSLLVLLFSREVILIMAAEEFHSAYIVVPPIIAAYLFDSLYYVFVTPVFYKKKTKIIPLFTGIAAFSNLGLNLLWIPKYGIMGAAYATLISFGILTIVTYFYSNKIYPIQYKTKKILIVITMFGIVYILNSILPFEGILFPILIKLFIFLTFIVGLFLFKVINIERLKTAKEFFVK